MGTGGRKPEAEMGFWIALDLWGRLYNTTLAYMKGTVMNDMPLYASKRTGKSLWQQYRIYSDRLELQSWFLLHTLVVPRDKIQAVEVRPSVLSSDKGFTWGIKLDNCDLCRHVLLTKKSGVFKRIGFSPDQPEEFVEVCTSILPTR